MAQHKYDLVTLPTTSVGPPRHHPWYKERLDLKYTKRGQKSGCLDGRKWTLIAGNVDDFRSGAPPHITSGSMVVKGKTDPFPLLGSHRGLQRQGVWTSSRRGSPAVRYGPGVSTLHSKVGPQRQSKLARLQQLEHQLLQRPISLYPHLRDSIPDKIAEEVILMLEGRSQRQKTLNHNPQKGRHVVKNKDGKDYEDLVQQEEVPGSRRLYRWPLRQTEEEVQEERRTVAAQKVISPGQEARVSQVTHNLVEWGRELGGSEESAGIDEATVKNLFSSDYESRPMTTPERVVDVCDVPHELLRETSAQFSAGTHRTSLWDSDTRRRSLTAPAFSSDLNVYSKPCCIKSRYGAWYLPTSLWKVQKSDEPLYDPRNLTSESAEELARQDQELDLKVSQLHGTQAFKQYFSLHKPGSVVPSFLPSLAANESSQNTSNSYKRHV